MPRHKRILLIGSADPRAGIPYQALSRRWYRVAIMADHDEALLHLRQVPPDLVLLDDTSPLNDMVAICAALQEQELPIPLII